MKKLERTLGKLIVIEGLDGSGSTTQLKKLSDWLRKKQKYQVYSTYEPSDGPIAKWLRQALQTRIKFTAPTLALLFLADRLDHAYGPEGFVYHLEENSRALVLLDRYYLSTFAYQTLDPEIKYEWLMRIHSHVPRPYITFFIDTPVSRCLERIAENRGYHFELFEAMEKLQKIREHYLEAIEYLRNQGELILVLDGDQPEDEVHRQIRNQLNVLLEGADYLEETLRRYSLINHAVELLAQNDILAFAARDIAQAVQIKLYVGDKRPLSVNFYRQGGEFSTIVVQGIEPFATRVRKILWPLIKELEEKKGEDSQLSLPFV